ncbi:MAG TPA: sialidase family protein [Clostridia bacterium]|nr:sialidase family protein [Clostridia bacterium]
MIKGLGALATAAVLAALTTAGVASASTYAIGSNVTVSAGCSGQNAEVLQAVDRTLGYVYEEWMGCRGIAFARSTDSGKTFGTPISVPGSVGSNVNVWDPAVTVAPDGTVYAVFMIARSSEYYPVIAASFDHGVTFPQVASLLPPDQKNWGDRPFLAVGPDGAVYVTWDYGPNRTSVTYLCATNGSCAFATGDLNVVMQKSTDRGRTWGPIVHVSPGFPASGGDSAPLLVEPNGRIDLSYQGYHITNTTTYTMDPANTYFTSSTDGGASWSKPVLLGPSDLTMSLSEWWIDGAVTSDSAGNLYATWDTQGSEDTGWLSFSTDHGKRWSALVRVTGSGGNAIHIMEVAGGGPGIAYVSWLTDASGAYQLFVRAYSITTGWLTPPILVSTQSGDVSVWPGDTTGISTLSDTRVVLSWGSGVVINNQPKAEIFSAVVDFQPS